MAKFRPAAPNPKTQKQTIRGSLLSIWRGDMGIFPRKFYRGKLLRIPTLGKPRWFVNDPDIVRQVLVRNQKNYPKHAVMKRLLKPLLGGSIFVTNGKTWERQRRMVNPALELSKLKVLYPIMLSAIEDLQERLRSKDYCKDWDVDAEMTHVTADVIFRTIFSRAIELESADKIFSAFSAYQQHIPKFMMLEVLGLSQFLLPFKRRQARKNASLIRRELEPLIRNRQELLKTEQGPDDLLTSLIRAKDPETGKVFSAIDLVDEIAFFFLAGHETSASGLSWCLYLIANDQTYLARIQAELDEVLEGRSPAFADLRKLEVTRNAFREALRLYPPVSFYIREAIKEDTLRDKKVCPHSQVIVSPWLIHRHEEWWDEPDMFDPDRFARDECKHAVRGAYLPFNAGPRICSGAGFAQQEAVLILATVLQSYTIKPHPTHVPEPVGQLTLRSRNGMRLFIEPRET